MVSLHASNPICIMKEKPELALMLARTYILFNSPSRGSASRTPLNSSATTPNASSTCDWLSTPAPNTRLLICCKGWS